MSTTNPVQGVPVPTSKNVFLAYGFWLILGWTGAHRYYLERYGSAVVQSLLFVIALSFNRGMSPFAILMLVWWIVDAFLIYGIVADMNATHRRWINNDDIRVGQATQYELNQLNDWHRTALDSAGQGDMPAAILMGNKALQQAERLFGRQHANVGVLKSNLGEFYRQQGDLVQAHRMLVEAIAIKESAPDPLDVVASMSNLVLVYMATEQYDQAAEVLGRMQMKLARCKSQTPLYYLYRVTCDNQFGQLAIVQGNFAEALRYFEAGTANVGRLPEDNGGLKLRMLINTGNALIGLDQRQRAEEFYQRAQTLYSHSGDDIPADIIASFARLGQALKQPAAAAPSGMFIPEAAVVEVAPTRPDVVLPVHAQGYVPVGCVIDLHAAAAK